MKKTHTATADQWSATKEDLGQLASDLVAADIEVVEASRALKAAQERHDRAIARQTTADKKLTNARKALGGEA